MAQEKKPTILAVFGGIGSFYFYSYDLAPFSVVLWSLLFGKVWPLKHMDVDLGDQNSLASFFLFFFF